MNNKNEGQEKLFGEPLDLVAERSRIEAERNAVSRYVKLQDGEMSVLTFTGRVFRAQNTFGSESVYFELVDVNDKNEHKLFSVGSKASIVPKLIEAIMNGEMSQNIMRAGIGLQTQYTIVKQRK
jgi:hypothetical protein